MKKTKPPETIRYCVLCEELRRFKYSPTIGHSECTICGGRFGKLIENLKIKDIVEKKTKVLTEENKRILDENRKMKLRLLSDKIVIEK